MTFQVPISAGELLDKITILEIKKERLAAGGKRDNVLRELQLLVAVRDREIHPSTAVQSAIAELRQINSQLWEIEDAIRLCEKQQDFGEQFVQLARAVYHTNDRRAALKAKLNQLLGSQLVEEKSYQEYSTGPAGNA